jgi:hypothetical protein
MRRGAVLGVLLVAVLWPSVSAAQEEPPDTTVPPPTTTAPPDTTVAPTTTVPEAPPTTVAPEPAPAPEVEAPSEGSTGERSVRVRPNQDLVDRQVVVVRGHGWRPRAYLDGAAQCRAGIAGPAGCGRVREARTDARGNFRVEYEVAVLLETPSGTFDCRVAPCVIRTVDRRSDARSRSARLYFDPAGPDPVRETATITPDSDLIDGQVVTIVGEDFDVTDRYGSLGEIIECRLPVTDRDDCDERTDTYAEIDRTGYLAASYRLEALLRVDGADVDCRTTACALFVGQEGGGLARAALVPLDFDPSAPLGPPPTVTVTPSTSLRDGQIVDVDGEGLRSKGYLILLQCRWGATDPEACTFETYDFVDVRADGTFHTQVALRAVFEDSSRERNRVNCRVTACSLTAFQDPYGYYYGAPSPEGIFGGDIDRTARVRLRFRPHAPLLEPSISTDDLTDVHSGQRWRIWGTGGRPEGTLILVQCAAGARRFEGCATGTQHRIHTHFKPRDRVGISWETRFRFQRHLHLANGRQVDCAAEPCELVAYEPGSGLDHSDRIRTTFAT